MVSEYYYLDQVFLGQRESLGKEIFVSSQSGRVEYSPINEERALKLLRYCIEYYLGWTPEQALEHLTPQIIKSLHLSSIVKKRLLFPPELDGVFDTRYLIHLLYPDRIPYDRAQAVEHYYDLVLEGGVSRFRKNFFTGQYAKYRAIVCFRRLLALMGQFTSVREMYNLFSKPEGRQVLTRYKLTTALNQLYELPIDYLHESLPEDMRDYMYYYKLKFRSVNEHQKRSMKRLGTFVA